MFPQHKRSQIDDLPFPFQEYTPDVSESNVSEYWKKSSSSMQAHSSQAVTASFSPCFDTSVSSLNYSSGWGCVGNISGVSIPHAFSCLQSTLKSL